MAIAVKRFVALEKAAQRALKQGDLKTIELINSDEELRSASCQFVVGKDGRLYLGLLDQMEKEQAEDGIS